MQNESLIPKGFCQQKTSGVLASTVMGELKQNYTNFIFAVNKCFKAILQMLPFR